MIDKERVKNCFRKSVSTYNTNATVQEKICSNFIFELKKHSIETKRVLEIGCGTGFLTRYFLNNFAPHKYLINDIVEENIESIKSIFEKKNFSNWEFLGGDAENINFSNDSFDMTMTTFALHEKSKSSAKIILNEMIRLTKKNGHLIIIDFSIDRNTFFLARKGIELIESHAGDDHYKHYKEYVAYNGLNTLLEVSPLKEVEKHYFAFNGVILKVMQKTK